MIEQQCQESVNQRDALKERQEVTALRLDRAGVLIEALADEEVRIKHFIICTGGKTKEEQDRK